MKSKQSYIIPRINTRGRYDLRTGLFLTNKKNTHYTLFPKYKFDRIEKADEIVIFVHGMRNSRTGAAMGTRLLRRRLLKLGYKYPVVAFSYDADIRGAHIDSNYNDVITTATVIAVSNGIHLSKYVEDLKEKNSKIKIHIVGHSLGCIVAEHCVWLLGEGVIKSVHLLGSPVELELAEGITRFTRVVNYYNPIDNVIIESVDRNKSKLPTCLIKKVPNAINR